MRYRSIDREGVTWKLLSGLVALALIQCVIFQPQPVGPDNESYPPPNNLSEVEGADGAGVATGDVELTEQERALFQQIVDLYAAHNLPYIHDVSYFVQKSLRPGESAPAREMIKINLTSDQLARIQFILSLTPALIGQEKSQQVLWEIGMVPQPQSGQEDPTRILLGTVDPELRKMSFTQEYLDQDTLVRKLTFLHELLHLLDLVPELFDLETRLKLELIKSQFIFENGGPDVLYELLYLDGHHAGENFISDLGAAFMDNLDEYLPPGHAKTAEIQTEVANMRQNSMEQVLHFRLGQLLLNARAENPDFTFSQAGESILAQSIANMVTEAFAEAVSLRIGSAQAFAQNPEQMSRNAQLIVRYFQQAGGTSFSSMADLQGVFFDSSTALPQMPFELTNE